jgi:hypothetical protein
MYRAFLLSLDMDDENGEKIIRIYMLVRNNQYNTNSKGYYVYIPVLGRYALCVYTLNWA